VIRPIYACDYCGTRFTTSKELVDDETTLVDRSAHPVAADCRAHLCEPCTDEWQQWPPFRRYQVHLIADAGHYGPRERIERGQ
jgi:hypothetical protein